jgi:8-hydroxy-5-deazaflavin:NADPH oxidoreductase
MRIAVLGTGMVGRAIAERLDELGHEVTVGTRDVERTMSHAPAEGSFADWLSRHPAVHLATFADAAAGSELVVNTTPGDVSLAALDAAGAASLEGKVLVDISNPLDFSQGFPPTLFVKDTDSLGERIQAAFPDVLVVKALSTLNAELMVHPEVLAGGDHTVFVSGDDAAAKGTVTELLRALGHTDIIDLGDISTSRGPEMFLPLWLRIMGALGTYRFNIKVVR